MNATPHAKFVPVLPRRRRDWEIPAVDAYERLVEERRKEARLKARWAGTTPYGREIFRRMLQRAWTLVREKQKHAGSNPPTRSRVVEFL